MTFVKLKSSFPKFYGRHHDFVDRYGISVSEITTEEMRGKQLLQKVALA
jgi:hypothetical protein